MLPEAVKPAEKSSGKGMERAAAPLNLLAEGRAEEKGAPKGQSHDTPSPVCNPALSLWGEGANKNPA
jgi:hypothetical protein